MIKVGELKAGEDRKGMRGNIALVGYGEVVEGGLSNKQSFVFDECHYITFDYNEFHYEYFQPQCVFYRFLSLKWASTAFVLG